MPLLCLFWWRVKSDVPFNKCTIAVHNRKQMYCTLILSWRWWISHYTRWKDKGIHANISERPLFVGVGAESLSNPGIAIKKTTDSSDLIPGFFIFNYAFCH